MTSGYPPGAERGEEEQVKLTVEEAEAMLPDKEEIHTILQTGLALLGADWSREAVLETFRNKGVELSGDKAKQLGHGLVTRVGDEALFVETREDDH